MPEDTESNLGNKPIPNPADKASAADTGGGASGIGRPPPVPPHGHAHQLTSFPVVALILLHYLTCGVFSWIWLNLMHGKLPRVRSDDPSAGRAIGFCFIPFFNLYWIFFTLRRLCLRVDEQRELYGLPPSNLRGMATTACIFQVIPYVNALFGYTVVTPIYIGLMQSSINQLVKKSATTAPRATLPIKGEASGMPVWGIVLVCVLPVFLIAFLAAMLLPALAAAKRKAQEITSINNMKQIGLAFRIWEGDHNGQFPFNVSQAQGGTRELCQPDNDGYDHNPAPTFMVMSNELFTPRILICPNDLNKHEAVDFASLTGDNISYQLRTGTNVVDSNPQEILLVDSINGLVLYCDGSVHIDRHYKK
jgi:hypothetical protein